MVVVKKSSQTNKTNQPNSGKTSQTGAKKATQTNSSKSSSQTSSAKPDQRVKSFPNSKQSQSQANKPTLNENASKPDQKDRAIIPKSKIPPSVSNFDEVAQDPLKHILQFTKKRLRNLEGRKDKLHGYQKKLKQGEEVDMKKQEALSKYNEVLGSITLAEEFTNLFTFLSLEVDKVKERMQKSDQDRQRKQDIERSQFSAKCLAIFNLLVSDKKIQDDFLGGNNKAVQLKQTEIDLLLKFSDLCLLLSYSPGDNVLDKADKCGFHLTCLFNASPNKVFDSTYADIRLIINKICKCGYFNAMPDMNKVIKTDEEDNEANNEEVEEANLERSEEDQEKEEEEQNEIPEPEGDFVSQEETSESPVLDDAAETEPASPPTQTSDEFNKFSSYTATENQPKPISAKPRSTFEDIQAVIGSVSDPQLQKLQMSFMSFQVDEQPEEPMIEKAEPQPVHTIEQVLADVQGQYNFLQDSVIDMSGSTGDSGGNVPYSGSVLQPSAGVPDAMSGAGQSTEGLRDSQYNPSNDRAMEKDSFLPNGPTIMANEISTSHLHHTTASDSMYYVARDKPSDKFTEPNSLSGQESQLKQAADNLGMGQTTFGANETKYNVDIPPNTQYNSSTLHSVDSYQQQSSDLARMKQLPENTYSTSPFSTLHGNSQSPFEGALASNKIPDPIPLPGNAAALSQTLAAADPPATHIPFPTDEMSGYRGYAGAASSMDATSAMGKPAEDRNEQFSALQDKSHPGTLLSAGDAVHIPSPVMKLDSTPVDNIAKDPVPKPEESQDMASTSGNNEDKSMPAQANPNRNTRGSSGYQNSSTSNYNRGNNGMPRQQGQAMGGFYQSRSNNYRPSHNRNYGNFDSMGHPKHFGSSGGSGYQQGNTGMAAPFPSHYNRQDNGMYGGGAQRRGAGGSGRGSRGGYPPRVNNMRNGGGPNNNYNRSRTFRPQNSDQVV